MYFDKKFRKLLNILKFESKVSCKGLKVILQPKSDSKDLKWKFPKMYFSESVETSFANQKYHS